MASDIEAEVTQVEEPQVEQPVEEVVSQEEPQQTAILNYLKESGYSVDEFTDDNEVLEEFGALANQLDQMPSEDEINNPVSYTHLRAHET